MKFTTIIWCSVFVYLLIGTTFADDNKNEISNGKRVWNMLRDLKDRDKGRIQVWNQPYWEIETSNNNADRVDIKRVGDPDLYVIYGVSFPLPNDGKNIEEIVIEMDFKWPKSQWTLQLTFGEQEKKREQKKIRKKINGRWVEQIVWLEWIGLFHGTGIVLSFNQYPGISIGRLHALSGLASKELVNTSSLSMMGKKLHTLKITYRPDEKISATFDNKNIEGPSDVEPSVVTLLSDAFDPIEIHRLQMTVTMKK